MGWRVNCLSSLKERYKCSRYCKEEAPSHRKTRGESGGKVAAKATGGGLEVTEHYADSEK